MKNCLKNGGMLFACLVALLAFSADHAAPSDDKGGVVFECSDIGVEARRMLSKLKKEKKRISRRKKELEQRENELKIMEREIEKKLQRLRALRKDLKKLVEKKETMETEKVKKLSRIYQEREPARAAASLEAMDKSLAVAILSMMRGKYAGEILDSMKNETAVAYSTALGRLGE